MGYDCKWTVMGAADVGANHQRDRIWIVGKVGNTNNNGQTATKVATSIAERSDPSKARTEQASQSARPSKQYAELALAKCKGLEGQRIKSGQQEVSQSGDDGALAYTPNCWNVWRDGFMGTAEQEHYQRGSQIDGSRKWWQVEPNVGRVADGVAARVDRLKAIGNGQVPLCAAEAWRLLSEQG